MANSTTHNYVDTLVESGYLAEEDRVYRLNLMFLDYGVHAKRNLDIARISPPILGQLKADTEEAV